VSNKIKKDIAASVHQRLLNNARENGRPFQEVLQYYAMERFLYRLSKTGYRDRFILKGALLFSVWQVPGSRPTRDIDLLGRIDNSLDTIVAAVKEICLVTVVPDGIIFDAESIEGARIVEGAEYQGVRIQFRGNLGRTRLTMQLDIGFGDTVVPSVTLRDFPTVLDLPAPRLKIYSRESLVAEKFEAMVSLGLLNSRMKDFYDIGFLSRHFSFDGQTLAKAIVKTFSNRNTEIPSDLSSLLTSLGNESAKHTQWSGFLRKARLQGSSADFNEVLAGIDVFLGPITKAIAAELPFQQTWRAPGPWSTEMDDLEH